MEWHQPNVQNMEIVTDPTIEQAGIDLPRKAWVSLNRIRRHKKNTNFYVV